MIEVVLVARAQWWNLPYRTLGYWAAIFFLICTPLMFWLAAAKKWAFYLATLVAITWIVASIWLTAQMHYPSLGFFSLLLVLILGSQLLWMKIELERSFLDPQLAWYQGLPKPISGLKCQLRSGERTISLRVSRIDKDGAFVFIQPDRQDHKIELRPFLQTSKLEMTFDFKDFRMTCRGLPTLSIAQGAGVGIRFLEMSADLKKEIGDFLELLQGEGRA
jgi:hypothetical protein